MNRKCGFSSFLSFYDLVSPFHSGWVHPAMLHLHSPWLHVLFPGSLLCVTPFLYSSSCWQHKPGFSQRNAFLRQASASSARAVTMSGQLCHTATNNSGSGSALLFAWREMQSSPFRLGLSAGCFGFVLCTHVESKSNFIWLIMQTNRNVILFQPDNLYLIWCPFPVFWRFRRRLQQ